ncbi:conserved protein of unknown function [Pararobbsia alpina]|uniref:hypothetical protein n=1 Tax=Pararobbsia alpina TaxID=621374 RepID=UPI0039A762F9
MGTLATIISVLNGAWTLLGNLFGFGKKPADENTQAVEVANKAGALSADQARETRAQTEKELSANEAQTTADADAVRNAGSLRDGSDDINQAIARARSHADSDH